MFLMRVLGAEHHVETTLHHPAASAFALERLGGDEDFQIRARVMGIKRRHLGGGAHSDDQEIRLDRFDHSLHRQSLFLQKLKTKLWVEKRLRLPFSARYR